MASQVYCTLSGPNGSACFDLSTTEGTWGELLDMVGDLSLGESMRGMKINSFIGSYNAGTGIIRVRNKLRGNQVKMLELLPIVTEERTEYLERPFTVEEGDIIEAMTQAVA